MASLPPPAQASAPAAAASAGQELGVATVGRGKERAGLPQP